MAVLYIRDEQGEFVEVPTLKGRSAYEIAAANGFDGTETEWLASLKGETGAPGTDGKTPVRGVDYWTDADRQEILEDTYNTGASTAVKLALKSAGSCEITDGSGALPDGIGTDCAYLAIFHETSNVYASGVIVIASGAIENDDYNSGSLGIWTLLVKSNKVKIEADGVSSSNINGTLNFYALSTDGSTPGAGSGDGDADYGTDTAYSTEIQVDGVVWFRTSATTGSCPTLKIEVFSKGFYVKDETGTTTLATYTYRGSGMFAGIKHPDDAALEIGTGILAPGNYSYVGGQVKNVIVELTPVVTLAAGTYTGADILSVPDGSLSENGDIASNGVTFTQINVYGDGGIVALNNVTVYADGEWKNGGIYRTITIKSDMEVSPAFYSWFTESYS